MERVLLTADPVGGVWTYALELAAELGRRGLAVALASIGAPLTRAQREEVHRLSPAAFHESAARLEWMPDPWDDVRESGQWLLGIAREFRPDVVHLNGYAHAALPFEAPVLVVGHSCVLSWWEAVRGGEAPASWDRYRAEVRRGLRAADRVAAPSRAMAELLRRHWGCAEVSVTPNGRSAARYRAAPKEPLILAVGRLWDEAKNVAALARVAPRIPWEVCVAGETRHPDGRDAEGLDGVRALGRLSEPELAGWYARASLYVLPARYEPFGLSALEAALSGCALVLGDLPSLREVWGEAAAFVPPDDDEALARELQRLATDEAARAELARRALARARQLTPARMGEGYLGLYRSLVRSGRARCAS